MAKKTLFNRANKNEINVDIHDENIWDDTLLIKAYDESIQLVKEEVAKKLAKATNKSSNKKDEKKSSKQNGSECFKIGDYVRATYTDGIDYEAKILNILEDKTCLLRYIGYGNEEYVPMNTLVPSWGGPARTEQKSKAENVNSDCTNTTSDYDDDEDMHKCGNTSKKRKSSSKLPRDRKFINSRSSIMIPPPPPMPPMIEDAGDAEHLSAMLMSWYMSGYYTGLYQGQRSAKK